LFQSLIGRLRTPESLLLQAFPALLSIPYR